MYKHFYLSNCSGCVCVAGKTSFNDRYNSFFVDYSLLPLLVQQNYIDASKSGVLRGFDEVKRMDYLSLASDTVGDLHIHIHVHIVYCILCMVAQPHILHMISYHAVM